MLIITTINSSTIDNNEKAQVNVAIAMVDHVGVRDVLWFNSSIETCVYLKL